MDGYEYSELLNSINIARSKTANFYKVDLHVHTINSHDFPSTHSKKGFVNSIPIEEKDLKSKPDLFKTQFINRAKQQGLHIVAITDHNDSDMAEQLSLLSDEELVILPGIEISATATIFPESEVHILGLFPQGTSSKEIDKVFPANCGMPPSGKRKAGDITNQPIDDILKIIHQLGGISIAAHVSSTKGFRAVVQSQNIEWLQKNYLRRYLKSRQLQGLLSKEENDYLSNLQNELKPLDDKTQNTYLTFLAEHDFNAIQIQESEHQQYYSGVHVALINLPPFPCLLSTDTHTLADLGCPGHTTFVKLTDVGLEGLKKALLDPDTRLRYDTDIFSNKPRRILGISFEGGSLDGQVIGFSDNLTTLIGGRGTGKSALIEAIRFVLNQKIDNLPDRLQKDIEERWEYTLRNTEVKLLFTDGQSDDFLIIKRRMGENKSYCYNIEGRLLPEIELPDSEKTHVEIYGWNEIEALSDSPQKQLALLDRTIQGINTLKINQKNKFEELRKNNSQIINLATEVKGLLPFIQNAAEMRLELDKLNTPELNDAFSAFDQNERVLNDLREFEKEIVQNRNSLLDNLNRKDFSFLTNNFSSLQINLASYSWFEHLSKTIEDNTSLIQNYYNQLIDTFEIIITKVKEQIKVLEEEHNSIEAQLNSIAEKSGQGDFKTALSRRKDLSEKLSKMIITEREIEKKEQEIEELLNKRKKVIIPELMSLRHQVFNARLQKSIFVTDNLSLLDAAKGVGFSIVELGDRSSFSQALGFCEGQKYSGLFKNIDKQYINKNYPEYFAHKFTPHDFIEKILNKTPSNNDLSICYVRTNNQSGKIVKFLRTAAVEGNDIIERDNQNNILNQWSTKDYELVEMTDEEKIWKHLSPWYFDNEINEHLDPEKLKHLLELDVLEIDDKPIIVLDNRPIEELSPGQRCGALIPIILVEGNSPIIIDQPEDNLDNKMVFDLVVDIIRGLKEKRQIIVATHNPNIPVSGDAEQIIVFEAPDREKCIVVNQASIDDQLIINQIKAIMEGGDKAFEVRMKKYGILQQK